MNSMNTKANRHVVKVTVVNTMTKTVISRWMRGLWTRQDQNKVLVTKESMMTVVLSYSLVLVAMIQLRIPDLYMYPCMRLEPTSVTLILVA